MPVRTIELGPRPPVNHGDLRLLTLRERTCSAKFIGRGFSGEKEQWPIPNTLQANTISTLQLIMRQQPIIIVKLLIITKAAATIEERNIRQ
jgi:hypothetical protein